MTETCVHCRHRKDSGPGCGLLFLAVLAYLFLFLPFLKFMVIARDHADERMARLERAAGLSPLSSPAPPSFVPWKFPERGLLDSEEQK